MGSEFWSAVGQMGAFATAIVALLLSIRAFGDSRRSANAAEASAQHAAAAVAEARRSNDLAAQARVDRLQEEERAIALQADLLNGEVERGTYNSRAPGLAPEHVRVRELRVTVANHSPDQIATDVWFRHLDHVPEWTLAATALTPGAQTLVAINVEPFDMKCDSQDLIARLVLRFQFAHRMWIKRGNSPAVPADPLPPPTA